MEEVFSTAWWMTGCRRVKLHSVEDHEASAAHREAIETDLKQRQVERTSGFGASVTKRNLLLNDRCDHTVVCVLKALYWIAKEDILLRKWNSLKDLLVQVSFHAINVNSHGPVRSR